MKDANIYNVEIHYNEKSVYYKEVNLIGFNKKVLEFGCNIGYISNILKNRGCKVTGIEINENAAKKAREHCEKVIVADIDTIELDKVLGDEKFDVALFGDVLEHLKDAKKILLQTKDILNKDGKVIISVPNIAHWSIRLDLLVGNFNYENLGILDKTHLKFFTKKSIIDLLNSSGYYINSIDYVELDFDWIKINHILKMKGLNESEVRKIFSILDEPEAKAYQYIISSSVCSEHNTLKNLMNKKLLLEEEKSKLQKRIYEKDAQINDLSEHIKQKEVYINNLNKYIKEKDAQIDELNKYIKEKDAQINALNKYIKEIQNTISWRITSPLRTIYAKIHNLIKHS